MTSQIKEKIKAELFAKRQIAIEKANFFKQKALENAEYKALDKTERALVFDIAKNEAEGKKTTDLLKQLEEVKAKKVEVLNKLKISENDLIPHFSCKKCNDTGFYEGEPCSCFKERLNYYLADSNSDNLADFKGFKDFNNDNLVKVKNFLLKWATDKNYNQILLCGKTGVGKTFLGECALNELKKQGKSVLKVSAFKMNELFTKFHTCFDYERADYLDGMLTADALMIDDLGTEPMKRNITKEYLYLLLNERKEANKLTIITTNFDLEDILKIYEERIFSRLADKKSTKCILIEGKDLRFNN
ncbi:MAG: ATP-binding protein [bacterium]|nr:ATP-binding protein [bacterium]